MPKKRVRRKQRNDSDFPLSIRAEDMEISRSRELLITGRPAEVIRRLLLNYPDVYPKSIVPFIQAREKSFRPSELWLDPKGRIHIANKGVVARARHHMKAAKKNRARK